MSRPSENDNVVPMTPGAGRPEPPAELDADEKIVWQEIVGALPATWFKTETLPILRGLVSHIVTAQELERRMRVDRKSLSLKDLRLLTTLQARETAAIAKLSAALRLTPKSQYAPITAARQRDQQKTSKPWDIKGRE